MKTIGFPHMQKETGEKRAFLPDFIQYLTRFVDVYLTEGYGSRMGFSFDDYRQGNPRVFRTDRRTAFQQDFVMILRSPAEEEYCWIKPGSCLISMLHYPTRPYRVELLNTLRVNAISLDSIVDDNNLRLVENMRAVAWNGIEVAFNELETIWPNLIREPEDPYRVLILGTGMVGKHAIEAATKLGNSQRNYSHMEKHGPGSVAISIGRNSIGNLPFMEAMIRQADVLVDATQRRDPSVPVVPNQWIGWLPQHAVVVDLSVDPYLLDRNPPIVRGLEGVPQGNLDKYVFHPEDEDWDLTVPPSIPSTNRRTTTSCYSWPGIHPEACMDHYGRQLEPLMEVLLQEDYENIDLSGGYFTRALARAKLPPTA